MKQRNGFVSNSSSSSFIINKKDLTTQQIADLKDINEIIKNLPELDPDNYFYDSCWNIVENTDNVSGYTTMDNYNIKIFLKYLNIDPNKIEWNTDDDEW